MTVLHYSNHIEYKKQRKTIVNGDGQSSIIIVIIINYQRT